MILPDHHKHAQYLPQFHNSVFEQENVAWVGAGNGTRGKIWVIKKRHHIPREKSVENSPTRQDMLAHLAYVKPVKDFLQSLYMYSGLYRTVICLRFKVYTLKFF